MALPQLQADWCTRQGPACLRAVCHDLKRAGAVEDLREIREKQLLKYKLALCHQRWWDDLALHVRCALLLL